MQLSLDFFRFYIRLRLLQTKRIFAALGFGYLLFWAVLIVIVFLSIYEKMLKSPSVFLSIAVLLPISALHLKRKDEQIIRQIPIPAFWLYLMDNTLVSLPILLMLSFSQSFLTILLSLIYIGTSALIPPYVHNNYRNVVNLGFIPLTLFEWRIGLRQGTFIALILYCVGLVAISFWGVAIIIFTFFLLSIIILFYENVEPKEWLATPFSIRDKILNHCKAWSILILPYLLALLFFQFEFWYLSIMAWLYGVLIITFIISYKYAIWSPFRRSAGLGVIGSLFLILTITIAGAIFTIIATIYYFQKANKNHYLK